MIARAATKRGGPARALGLGERVLRMARPAGLLAGAAHRLAGNTPQSLLTGLLIELDETILPRRIGLESDTGRRIELRVARRRIWPETDAPQQHRQDTAESILDRLRETLRDAKSATLVTTRIGAMAPGEMPAIPVSAVIAAAALVLTPQSEPDPIPGLCEKLNGITTARIRLDNAANITGRDGDPADLARLDRLVGDGLKDMETQLGQSLAARNQPGCLILNAGAGNGLALILARSRQSGVLALLPAANLPDLQRAWRGLH